MRRQVAAAGKADPRFRTERRARFKPGARPRRVAPRHDAALLDPEMIEDVRQHLAARPFEPFVIVTSSGHRYRVPSADHAGINPRGSRVVAWFDDGSGVTFSGLHIAAIEKEPAPSAM